MMPSTHSSTTAGAAHAGFQLRPAAPGDAGAILAYLRQMGGESDFVTFGPEGIPMSEEAEAAHIANLATRDNALFLLAMDGERIVGALTFAGGERARLRHVGEFGVSVLRAWWGRGVAGALIRAMLDWARRGGVVRKINLKVRADHERGIALYERLGWKHEGRTTRDLWIGGRFHDGLYMGQEIDPAGDAGIGTVAG